MPRIWFFSCIKLVNETVDETHIQVKSAEEVVNKPTKCTSSLKFYFLLSKLKMLMGFYHIEVELIISSSNIYWTAAMKHRATVPLVAT